LNPTPLQDLWAILKVLAFLLVCVVVICATVAMMNRHWFEFSEQTSESLYTESEFVLVVKDNGETVYKAANGISDALKDTLLSTKYRSPEAAEAAATEVPRAGWWWPYLETREAEAHANNVCTTRTKVSLQTGGGRHITKHRGDWNGKRHTRTDHQTLTQNGYQTYDTFFYSVNKRYC